ncbi:MAG: FHA domain-containing protein [Fuerstiella sp.]
MSFSGQIFPHDTIGYFRIASATGRQPIEPVPCGEFRIGSAASCQLRIGDSGIPDVHTILHVDRDEVRMQSCVSEPPILINGAPTTECRLQDGDLVELASHRLLFRMVAADNRITLDEGAFADTDDSTDPTPEQLVDRLQEQLDIVEQLTRAPDEAVLELLTAVARSAAPVGSVDQSVSSPSTELQQIRTLLQKHHEASRIRLESLTEVLNNVVRQQKLIADTLEVMSSRIQALDSSSGFQQHRASA